MSDTKMSDVFGGSLINYSLSSVMTLTGIEKDAAIQAIKQHDTMQARIVELEKAISGILNSPHTKLTKGALLEVSEVDIDAAIKALEK